MQVPQNQSQVFLLNGQQIEILEKQNERGNIKTYSAIQRPNEKNVLIIEINSNVSPQGQLLVYDQVHYEFYKEKLQFTFLKTKNESLYQLCENQLILWQEYFEKLEFKILPLQEKHRIFRQYCRKNIKSKTYDLCLILQDHLGDTQIKGIDYRLFRDNDIMDQLDVQINQGQLNFQQIRYFGNLYFQILTDIDSRSFNQITEDQRVHIIKHSPIYEWQKQEIIKFLNPAFVQEQTLEKLLNLFKEDHFDIGAQQCKQQTEIIFQFSLQQQQVQSKFNYLYLHTKDMKNNSGIYQEYLQLNKLNSDFQKSIQDSLKFDSVSNQIEELFTQQLDELNSLSYQFYSNLRKHLCKNLMIKHKALELKLNKFYQPTQYIGQYGQLQINLYSKLQHQNKTLIQNIEQQSNVKIQNDLLSILQFNESLNKLNWLSQNSKAEFQAYKKQLVTELMKIKALLESNLRRIQQKFQHINMKYLMMVANQDESDQLSFVTNILERQQFLKNILQDVNKEIPNFIQKNNKNTIDILSTIKSYQELECRIGSLNETLEEKYKEVIQFEQGFNTQRSNLVKELWLKNQEKLKEIQQEFTSQFQSIKQFQMNFSKNNKNKNYKSDQEIIQLENGIELIVQKQFYRFSIIEELIQQSQTNKQYCKSISKKIEEERSMIQISVNQQLKVLDELFQINNDKQGELQEQEILDFELSILTKHYHNVKCELEQEILYIQQKYSSLETAYQEQLLLSKKIEILCQENNELLKQYSQSRQKMNEVVLKLKEKFQENQNRFQKCFCFIKEVKANINLQKDQQRLCLEIQQQQILIQGQFQAIQTQNITKSREEKRKEYQQLRRQLDLIQKDVILKGKQIGFTSQGYQQQLTLIILSKFYHMSRFHYRLMQAKALNSHSIIHNEDLELLNLQKDEYEQLESQVDYYRKVVIENGVQAFQIENLTEKLEDLEQQIELKKNYLLSVIECTIKQQLKKSLKSAQMIDKISKFINYLEFSQFLPIQLLTQTT
ncbi:unnamed protein product [Paramecium octaurelia]|uniref:Uncharacterized protein n=1 Tax=Paramecium octaurelia TaxID=43137 RepID=A0A8S1X031_PAROT|nr:unnamed protein product [Paramecium octaurelia]